MMTSTTKRTTQLALLLLLCCASAYVAFLVVDGEQSGLDVSSARLLRSIDRSLDVQPSFASPQPGYALLVFGENLADARWLILDDNQAYFDRNGDQRLGHDEKIPASNVQMLGNDSPFSERRDFVIGDFSVGETQLHQMVVLQLRGPRDEPITLPDGFPSHAESPNLSGSITVEIDSTKWRATPVFGRDVDHAPVIHFGGPLTVQVQEPFASNPVLKRGEELEINLSLGTVGVGLNAFAFCSNDEIPQHIRPQIRASFANRDSAKPPLEQYYTLAERC